MSILSESIKLAQEYDEKISEIKALEPFIDETAQDVLDRAHKVALETGISTMDVLEHEKNKILKYNDVFINMPIKLHWWQRLWLWIINKINVIKEWF